MKIDRVTRGMLEDVSCLKQFLNVKSFGGRKTTSTAQISVSLQIGGVANNLLPHGDA